MEKERINERKTIRKGKNWIGYSLGKKFKNENLKQETQTKKKFIVPSQPDAVFVYNGQDYVQQNVSKKLEAFKTERKEDFKISMQFKFCH